MAKVEPLKADIRARVGRAATTAARRSGLLPAVVYGHKQANVHVTVPRHEFVNLLHHGTHLFELQLPGQPAETVLVKEVQYDYLGTNPVHVDFTRVDLTERVAVTVPVVLRGVAAGVKEGGVLQQVLAAVEIECVVTDIPSEIRARVTDLQIGKTITAGELVLPEGAKLLTDPTAVVASVSVVQEEVAAAEPVEGAVEPELIGKGKEEGEGEQAEAEGAK